MTKTTFHLNPSLSFTLGRNRGVPEWVYGWVCAPGLSSSGLMHRPEAAPHLFRFAIRSVLEPGPLDTLMAGFSLGEIVDLWKRGWILTPEQAAAHTEPPLAHHVLDDCGDGSTTDLPSGRDQIQRLAPDLAEHLHSMALPTGDGRETERANMAATGLTVVEPLIDPACAAAATRWYKTLLGRGIVTKYDPARQRHNLYNDPVGRTLLHHLHPALSALAGTRLRPTYSYAALYGEGATLPWHIDRDECAFSLSLFLAHDPEPEDGRNPWPLDFMVDQSTGPVSLNPHVGGGVFFRGEQIPHGRPALAMGKSCVTLMLHYVPQDDPPAQTG